MKIHMLLRIDVQAFGIHVTTDDLELALCGRPQVAAGFDIAGRFHVVDRAVTLKSAA